MKSNKTNNTFNEDYECYVHEINKLFCSRRHLILSWTFLTISFHLFGISDMQQHFLSS